MVTSLQTENSIYDIDFNKKIIVIGNESNGVSQEIQDMADEKAKIPMLGKTESLNASVAAGIVMYEYVRQKLNKSTSKKWCAFLRVLVTRKKNNNYQYYWKNKV